MYVCMYVCICIYICFALFGICLHVYFRGCSSLWFKLGVPGVEELRGLRVEGFKASGFFF